MAETDANLLSLFRELISESISQADRDLTTERARERSRRTAFPETFRHALSVDKSRISLALEKLVQLAARRVGRK